MTSRPSVSTRDRKDPPAPGRFRALFGPPTDLERPDTGRRQATARGTIINSAFQVGFGGLNLLKSLIVAGFLTAADYGVWGAIYLAVVFIITMKSVAVGDKFVQQSEPDQEYAFQKAFTLELMFVGLMLLALVAYIPLLTLAYGQTELLAPGFAISLMLIALPLQTPTWIYYRHLDFLRQRLLLAIDPLVSFVVTVTLAVMGAGFWSFVVGLIVGTWASGLVTMFACPYRIRLAYHSGTMREYVSFSWPLAIAVLAGLSIAQLSLLVGDISLGLAGAGAIALAGGFAAYTDSVDRIITQTIYPAVCRVRDNPQLLFEAFTKSNRLTLMWGMPLGIGLALFADDLVRFGVGQQWEPAVFLLQVFGINQAINHIGFNWDAFYRARGETRPVAIVGLIVLGVFGIVAVPLLLTHGLDGYALGMAVVTMASLISRFYFLARLFPTFEIARYLLRAIGPTIPATITVVVIRLVEQAPRTGAIALMELLLYVAVTIGCTLLFERELLREVLGYVRNRNLRTVANS